MFEELSGVLTEAILAVLVTLIGWVAREVIKFFKSKGITEKILQKKYIIGGVVREIEQTFTNASSMEKLNHAKEESLKILGNIGIDITMEELNMFIESSVNEINKAVEEVYILGDEKNEGH